MKKFITLILSCYFAIMGLNGQSTLDTVDFRTGVTRILKDYLNNFENIKDSTCVAACELNIFIPEGETGAHLLVRGIISKAEHSLLLYFITMTIQIIIQPPFMDRI